MRKILNSAAIFTIMGFSPAIAQADSLKIATTIAPIHSLVSQVISDQDQAHLLIPVNQSPHHYVLRPSDVKKIQDANIVFRVSPRIESQISDILKKFTVDSTLVSLSDHLETQLIPQRSGINWPHHHDHKDEHDHEEEHDHKDAHDHEEEHDHKDAHDHEEEHDHKDEHDHEKEHGKRNDHHIWMSTKNATSIIDVIVTELSKQNPEQAATYQQNGEKAKKDLQALKADIQKVLSKPSSKTFAVMHDSFQYFETEYGLQNAGALVLSPEQGASAKHLRALNKHLLDQNARCVFGEPQLNVKLAKSIAGDLSLHFDIVDPLGVDIQAGPDLYATMMRKNADVFATCFAAP